MNNKQIKARVHNLIQLPCMRKLVQSLGRHRAMREITRLLKKVHVFDVGAGETVKQKFVWAQSPQGHDFWEHIYSRMEYENAKNSWRGYWRQMLEEHGR